MSTAAGTASSGAGACDGANGACGECDGRCCAVFHFNADLDYVRARVWDGEFIADMLVPLTDEEALERAGKFSFKGLVRKPVEGRALYTCRHWDEDTRLCTVYDERPEMCREYPYDLPECQHGCGYQLPMAGRVALTFRRSSSSADLPPF